MQGASRISTLAFARMAPANSVKVRPTVSHNLTAGDSFDRRHPVALLRRSSVRLGVNNPDPIVADATYGYQSGTYNPRGRQFWLELAKEW